MIQVSIVVRIGDRTEIKKCVSFRPTQSLIKLHMHFQVNNLSGLVLNTISPKSLRCNFK